MEPKRYVTLSQHSGLMNRVMRLEEFRFLPSNHVWQRLERVTQKQMRYICALIDYPTTPERKAQGIEIIRRIVGPAPTNTRPGSPPAK